MTDDQELEALKDRAHSLDKQVKDNEYHIERFTHALANGEKPGRAISGLQDYHNRQYGLMFDLGKLEAQIEDLENRIREQGDRDRELVLAGEFADGQAITQEDYLGWLNLDAPEPADERRQDERHPHYEGEERMLKEMQREDREPDEYPDWWQR